MLGEVSGWLTRSTSAAPKAMGANNFWKNRPMGPRVEVAEVEVEPPGARPQAIMIAPARKFSCLLIPFSEIVEQSNPTGTRGSVDVVMILYFWSACARF